MRTRIILTRRRLILGLAGAAALALAACSADDAGDDGEQMEETGGDGGYSAPEGQDAPDETAGGVTLSTADTDLGAVVVDGDDMTLYMFQSDTQGADSSTCEGECADNWPALHGDDSAELEGVEGEVASIVGTDGQDQVTLNGWPLYYFVGDEAAGDVNGQGLMDAWWVLSPSGEPVMDQ